MIYTELKCTRRDFGTWVSVRPYNYSSKVKRNEGGLAYRSHSQHVVAVDCNAGLMKRESSLPSYKFVLLNVQEVVSIITTQVYTKTFDITSWTGAANLRLNYKRLNSHWYSSSLDIFNTSQQESKF